jgi:hypothetical protein
LSDDPALPPCSAIGSPPGGKAIRTLVTIERRADAIVGRSRSPDAGTLEFELRDAGSSAPLGLPVAGSIRGMAADSPNPIGEVSDIRVELAGAGGVQSAGIEAIAVGFNRVIVDGVVKGQVTFTDSQGRSGSCSVVKWFMQPAPFGP